MGLKFSQRREHSKNPERYFVSERCLKSKSTYVLAMQQASNLRFGSR